MKANARMQSGRRPVVLTAGEQRVLDYLRRMRGRVARDGRPQMVIIRVVDGVIQVFEATPRGQEILSDWTGKERNW